MYKLLLILIGSYVFYYFTNDIRLMLGVFILLTFLLVWGSQIDIIQRKESVSQAKGNIDDAFQKRHDILSKIYETTKGYIKFKENELESITNLFDSVRNPASNFNEKLELQNQVKNILINNIGNLRDDHVDKQFETFNRSINEVEENLSAARRFYNHSVKEYNTAISTFPTSITAKMKGFQVMSYFEVENENVKKDIELKF